MDWTIIITGAVGGLAAGLIAPLSPIVSWFLEKRRQKLEYKRELIRDAREALATAQTPDGPAFIDTPAYYAIRPYLSKKAVGMLETSWIVFAAGSRLGPVQGAVIDSLAQLERDWGLVAGGPEPRLPSEAPIKGRAPRKPGREKADRPIAPSTQE